MKKSSQIFVKLGRPQKNHHFFLFFRVENDLFDILFNSSLIFSSMILWNLPNEKLRPSHLFRRKKFWKMLVISVDIEFWSLTKKKGGQFFSRKSAFFAELSVIVWRKINFHQIFFLESKNSGFYGDFYIFCLIVGHREVKNFWKTHFETEV